MRYVLRLLFSRPLDYLLCSSCNEASVFSILCNSFFFRHIGPPFRAYQSWSVPRECGYASFLTLCLPSSVSLQASISLVSIHLSSALYMRFSLLKIFLMFSCSISVSGLIRNIPIILVMPCFFSQQTSGTNASKLLFVHLSLAFLSFFA